VSRAAYTLAELAARVGGRVEGDGGARIEGVAPLEDAGAADLSFLANPKYRRAFETTRAGAVVVGPGEAAAPGRNLLRAPDPYLAFAKVSTLFHPPPAAVPGVAPTAFVHPTARVDPSAEVMPFAYVGAGAAVGARSVLFPGVYLGPGAAVGSDCVLHANAAVREACRLGDRVVLQPGCVVGSDGFGYAFDAEGEGAGPRHYKVPQAGRALVEDDVELGANVCIDRGTLGDTLVGRGAKVDNLVQIAHNVAVGPLSILVAQVGVAGSTKLGSGVVVGGQAGIIGHLHIGDGVKLGAKSGVMSDVPAGETWSGTPARPHADWLREQGAQRRMPDLLKEVRRLRREIEALKGKP
jgi:UDP-3-O-[3-hydroxymyristoyl] glucosamine N-acyltransferase